MPGLRAVRNDAEAKALIEIGREDRALERRCDNGRGKEEALIQRRQQAEIRTDLLPKAGRGEAVGTALDKVRPAADVAADGSKAAAGVLAIVTRTRSAFLYILSNFQ